MKTGNFILECVAGLAFGIASALVIKAGRDIINYFRNDIPPRKRHECFENELLYKMVRRMIRETGDLSPISTWCLVRDYKSRILDRIEVITTLGHYKWTSNNNNLQFKPHF